jgi:hypothetical protein
VHRRARASLRTYLGRKYADLWDGIVDSVEVFARDVVSRRCGKLEEVAQDGLARAG